MYSGCVLCFFGCICSDSRHSRHRPRDPRVVSNSLHGASEEFQEREERCSAAQRRAEGQRPGRPVQQRWHHGQIGEKPDATVSEMRCCLFMLFLPLLFSVSHFYLFFLSIFQSFNL